MPAAQHVQPEQLKMFMSPREIMGSYDVNFHEREQATHADGSLVRPTRMETDDEMYARKLAESKTPGGWNNHKPGAPSIHESVGQEGVRMPVHLATGERWHQVGNGYHRIAAQADHDPDRLMPVMHHENLRQANAMGKMMVSSPPKAPTRPAEAPPAPVQYNPAEKMLLRAVFGSGAATS